MMQTIFEVSSRGNQTQLFAFCGIGVVIGIIIWRLMTHPESRREQFRDTEPFSQKVSLLVGFLVSSLFIVAGYFLSYSGGFHRIDTNKKVIVLHYRWPQGTVTLQRSQLQQVTSMYAHRRRYRVVLRLKNKRSYTSRKIARWNIKKKLPIVKKALSKN